MTAVVGHRSVAADALVGASLLTLAAALAVLALGVIVTSGVYGSRMAWLLGVVVPLLVATVLLSRLGLRAAPSTDGKRIGQAVFVSTAALVGVPLFLLTVLFIIDALLLALRGIVVFL